MAINPQFDRAGDFYRGLVPVWLGNRQGYTNKQGKYVWWPTTSPDYYCSAVRLLAIG
jgi:hypothetical protein